VPNIVVLGVCLGPPDLGSGEEAVQWHRGRSRGTGEEAEMQGEGRAAVVDPTVVVADPLLSEPEVALGRRSRLRREGAQG
jgi:hypothetical protein